METIRIQNLKSIVDSGDIELKNLTIVIGKNSSGKSTLLRTFPLLKQSMEKRLSSPILWFGDFVDFGSFRKALTRDAKSKNITLSFTFNRVSDVISYHRNVNFTKKVKLSLTFDDKNINKYLIEIKNLGTLLLILQDDAYSVYINDQLMEGIQFQPSLERSFFPQLSGTDDFSANSVQMMLDEYIFEYSFRRRRHKIINSPELLFSATKREKYIDELFEIAQEAFSADKRPLSRERVANYIIKETISDILSGIETTFRTTFKNVQYFGPLRARGDRFYRVQGLNIKEIDSNGENAPMILYCMKSPERKKFQKWCMENLGFYYDIDNIGDGEESTSIVVRCTSNNDNYNMTDVGFGYTQIFPIILSIWISLFSGESDADEKIIAIEQPELHLHPALQKKIIKTFIKLTEATKRNGKSLKFIIETHSETIVNYLGNLISDDVIEEKNVNLLVCRKQNNESLFDKMLFNKNGTIENWPVGFFSEDE